MTTRFAHIRYENHNGDIIPRGGWTYAYKFLPDGKIAAARSQCSSIDNYCRRIGRDICQGRMAAGKYLTFDYDQEVDGPVVDFLLDAEWK